MTDGRVIRYDQKDEVRKGKERRVTDLDFFFGIAERTACNDAGRVEYSI